MTKPKKIIPSIAKKIIPSIMTRKQFTIRLRIKKHWAEAELIGVPGEFEVGKSPRQAVTNLLNRLDHQFAVLGGAKESELDQSAKDWIAEVGLPFYTKVKKYKP